MQLNRYEMLTRLHEVVKPRTYLEIGVQTGASFTLAKGADRAVGVDPDYSGLTFDVNWPHSMLVESTSDAFFAEEPHFVGEYGESDVDLVFIDGMHRVEAAMADFVNTCAIAHPGTVVAFDDVLPRNDAEASRDMIPGDWTGDVYKVIEVLTMYDIDFWLLDTFPTGMLVLIVSSELVNNADLRARLLRVGTFAAGKEINVPNRILTRQDVTDPQTVLDLIQEAIHG